MSEHEQGQRLTGAEAAVIGMAGRFPGAGHIGEFWENLKNGVEAIWFFTPGELEKEGIEPGLTEHPDYIKARGAVARVDYFDADFFGYSPREASAMDPQMRIFHEIVWEALEDASYDPRSYEGVIALYAGAFPGFSWQVQSALSGNFDWGTSLLNDKDYLSTRIAYKLNLKGPCTVVQTACSTSLVAIHQAYRSLLTGECDMALAGGVSLEVRQRQGYLYREGMIHSGDGHCRAFDARATGVIAGSGAGIVLLKRLKKTLIDGDHIYALVKGSAVNNDGERKIGFTAPSIEGQAEVIRTAQRLARVEPETITYIETHGTGTDLGDLVEIEALKLAFNTEKKGICGIGSVKTNVGHLDAAAGVTGFIKTVLALKHQLIPPNLHFEIPNPKIDFENSPFYVVSRLTPWQGGEYPLRAGVSSFGIGGTNAHLILEQAPVIGEKRKEKDYQLIILSARTETALQQMTDNLANFLKENLVNPGNTVNPGQNPLTPGKNLKREPGLTLADVAYTLQVGRRAFQHRRMLVGSSSAEVAKDLESSKEISTFFAKEEDRPVIFMFPGQGAQYVDMGRELYEKEPLFRREMDRCFEILKPLTGDNIKEILYPANRSDTSYKSNKSPINRTAIAQPVIFIFEYALAKLLMEWGIQPYAMIGHSIGEYTAAYFSGVISLEDALRLVTQRGRLMQQVTPGAMVSVSLAEAELAILLESHPQLELAAVNSSNLCAVSGPRGPVEEFYTGLQAKGIPSRRLHTSHAFHSKMMDPVLDAFAAEVKQISLHPPQIPYTSNVTGDWLTPEQAASPRYWATHLRRTVRFAEGIQKILTLENAILVEVGPGQVLSTFARKHNHKKTGQQVINLVCHPGENIPDQRYLLGKIGQLWLHGLKIDWKMFHNEQKKQRLSLPTYPFEPMPYRLKVPNLFPTAGMGRKPGIANWFYIPQWKRSLLPLLPPGNDAKEMLPSPGPRLVFMDDRGLGSRLLGFAAALDKGEQDPGMIIVRKGETFCRVNPGEYTIDPAEPAHYRTLLQELQTTGMLPGQVVHLWGITGKQIPGVGPGEFTAAPLEEAMKLYFYSLLYLARALGDLKIDRHRRFDFAVVTDSMQEVLGGDGQCPEKAVVLGPVKVIPKEYPSIRCRGIDIRLPGNGGREEEEVLRQLAGELTAGSSHEMVALRGSHRWIQVFEPVRLEKLQGLPRQLKPGGVYLITGGLGGMGLVLARQLVETLQAKVVLINRSALPEPEQWQNWLDTHDGDDRTAARIRKLRELEQLGGNVLLLKADVASIQEMQTAIAWVKKEFGQIHGVIHAAGAADGGMILQRTPGTTEPVLAPKISGTLVLDTLLKNEPPDFFILCSSLSSIRAPFGQVAYCSANAFLDAYASYKNNRHQPGSITISINWGTWQQVGMAVETVKQLSGDPGVQLKDEILPREGVEAFSRILESGLPQVAVSSKDLPLLLKRRDHLKNEESQPIIPLTAAEKEEEEVPLHRRPDLSTMYIEPEDRLEQTLVEILQDFLGLRRVGIDDNFFELGMSSLDIVQVGRDLEQTLERKIPAITLFTYPTVRTLGQYFKQEEKADNTSRAPGRESDPAGASAEPEDLLQNTMDLLKDT